MHARSTPTQTRRAPHQPACHDRSPMSSQQQIDANRRNAKKSTGPRTAGGRKRSRMNALKHGMAAEEVVMPGEDPAELRASHRSFIEAWKPVGTIEAKLVWEITIADWRLRRARRIEPRLVELGSGRSYVELHDAEPDLNQSIRSAANMFLDLDGLDVIGKLLRYEAAAERSYYRAFHTLERLQAKRVGKDVSPPQIMHVHGK